MSQRSLSDFGKNDVSARCPVCTDTSAAPKGYRDAELLEHVYVADDLKQEEVAELFDCSCSTIQNWLADNNIEKPRFEYELPESDLRRLYYEERYTLDEIADHFGCSYLAVRNRFQIYGIEIRSTAESLANADDDSYRDEEWLRERYHGDGLSKQVIADQCGVSESTVQHWMNEFGIEARGLSAAQLKRSERRNEPYMDADLLETLYWDEGMTQREMAEYFDVTQIVMTRWMNKYDIQLRYAGAHGRTYETTRGEYVRSSHERRIADWLHDRDIDYEYEPDVSATDLRPDFRVNGDLIEYWGMLNRADYVERMHEKIDRYQCNGIEIVNLFPHDLEQLSRKLGRYVN